MGGLGVSVEESAGIDSRMMGDRTFVQLDAT